MNFVNILLNLQKNIGHMQKIKFSFNFFDKDENVVF